MATEQTSSIFTLPLFPLHSVLFPGFAIQLHVFEERYKLMISRCIERGSPFGVVLIREGAEVGGPAAPHEIGCVAEILAVKRLDEGRLELLAAGMRRFRVIEYAQADAPYLVGTVEAVDDGDSDAPEGLVEDTRALFLRYLTGLAERAGISPPEVELPTDAQGLGFCIGSISQMSPLEKQGFLASTDAPARLQRAKEYVEEQLLILAATETGGDEPQDNQPPVLVAFPLDAQEDRWRTFTQQARN